MELTKENQEIIIRHSKEIYPKECCGIITNSSGIINVIPKINRSITPEKSFIIYNDDISDIPQEQIIGFYHSHKDSTEFSIADIAFSEKLNKISVLYICDKNEFKFYIPNGATIPYVGRPFFIGVLDCFTLSRDYFSRELNVDIKDLDGFTNHPIISDYKEWKSDKYKNYTDNTLIKDFFAQQGFQEVGDLKKHDIILVKMPGVKFTSHICIYLGDNRILHHFSEFSEIHSYTNVLKRLTTHTMRHSSLI